ncbi:electron carrier/ protein disulfide oxidoreductase [Anaeramoeba flamelloides]|uniref:Electron carrier/ protein disulfide oxidoreductase n=1 Tax=Anaeramoeba flamelloides TaxID=1746091 RepID=A0AAV7ZZG2_9EUKA|nr:electron carrier/ protein disulfide oxidoreductase [Anaeramoeba flamelloides]
MASKPNLSLTFLKTKQKSSDKKYKTQNSVMKNQPTNQKNHNRKRIPKSHGETMDQKHESYLITILKQRYKKQKIQLKNLQRKIDNTLIINKMKELKMKNKKGKHELVAIRKELTASQEEIGKIEKEMVFNPKKKRLIRQKKRKIASLEEQNRQLTEEPNTEKYLELKNKFQMTKSKLEQISKQKTDLKKRLLEIKVTKGESNMETRKILESQTDNLDNSISELKQRSSCYRRKKKKLKFDLRIMKQLAKGNNTRSNVGSKRELIVLTKERRLENKILITEIERLSNLLPNPPFLLNYHLPLLFENNQIYKQIEPINYFSEKSNSHPSNQNKNKETKKLKQLQEKYPLTNYKKIKRNISIQKKKRSTSDIDLNQVNVSEIKKKIWRGSVPMKKGSKDSYFPLEIKKKNNSSPILPLYTITKTRPKIQIQINSLSQLLTIPKAVKYFKKFLHLQFNQENLLFFQEVKFFKQNCHTDKKIRHRAKYIYQKYIKIGSLYEINIESKIRNMLIHQVKTKIFSLQMFDFAHKAVYSHLELNSFKAFKQSELYNELIPELKKLPEFFSQERIKRIKLVRCSLRHLPLNEGIKITDKRSKSYKLSGELLDMLLDLTQMSFSVSSKSINFKSISKLIPFQRFVAKTVELKFVRLEKMNERQKICFFINLYNVLMLHSLIIDGITSDFENFKRRFKNTKYVIGDYPFSVLDILNGILRGNKNRKQTKKYFKTNDPRSKFTIHNFEKKVHFLLINNYLQNPTITLTLKNFEQVIHRIEEDVIKNNVHIEKNNLIIVPKLLQNYLNDFGGPQQFKKFLLDCLKENSNNKLKSNEYQNYSLKFIPLKKNSWIYINLKRNLVQNLVNFL